ncbi:hypothetical protein MTO98_15305 [Mucilaginibacter sp. SMC90]|uniref:SET domain-containing protein-lysine N-methyltransferase n=1 Tax=unclassified Mucilaginibacter TaxID=2617802 RepID=UPI001FB55D1B|nr:SET domain-containing protein-lysine N-methyltransferase [Mucilaginibacter sp. SMC90]UOE52442.1 hypothetical protein MTO98_15305 [Mucilaginibacter sp. SMC90]
MNQIFDMALPNNGMGILIFQASSIHGLGLFTNDDLPASTILCRRLGLRTALSLRDKRAIIGIDGIDPAVPEDFIFKKINHSCQPNATITDTGCLVNIERVFGDTEITVDYGQLLTGSSWSAACLCRSPNCRHIICSIYN